MKTQRDQNTAPQFAPLAVPLRFTAWQLIGWEGDCGTVRKVGGFRCYSDVMHNCATARSDSVKIARLDAGPREVSQRVTAETILEIVTISDEGREFLRFQGLIA